VTVWAARNLHLREGQRFTLSSSLASMGFALSAAIGAQLTYPDRPVVALAGDGGFSMLMPDLLTAVKYELPITVVVFNNAKLGLIQMEQEVAGQPEFETGLQDLDFGAFARLCGADGARVETPDELDDALRHALTSRRPAAVDVLVSGEERTMPPHIEMSQAWGYGVAKLKEMLGLGDRDGGPGELSSGPARSGGPT
jgi:thiamine pyrophosphate-dependent acetolactate synthase large subunit-like protein